MPAPPHRITLGMMAKYWDVGQVKTRLGKTIGLDRAAELHRLFVLHLCTSLSSFAGRRVVCIAPESRRKPFLLELKSQTLDATWEIMRQAEGNLGNRMERWFDAVLGDPSPTKSGAILIGADCPTLSVDLLEEAHRQLATHDVVLGPAADGGYYLIGISTPWSLARFHPIFDQIPWSTDQVFRITQERLVASGISCYHLPEREDIDTMAELNRLRAQLSAPPTEDPCGERSKHWRELGAAIESVLAGDPVFLDPNRDQT